MLYLACVQSVDDLLEILRCPATGQPLTREGEALVAGETSYRLTPSGIPLFAESFLSEEASRQQDLYDGHVDDYLHNLEQPHTQEYERILQARLLAGVSGPIETVVELCCGRGEALRIGDLQYGRGIGVDVSRGMLEAGLADRPRSRAFFVQGDATRLPLADACCDAVFMLGGIHHVNDRVALFSEVRRILRPQGRFHFREPVDDFLPWRLARKLVYRVSPMLDEETEAPLRRAETEGHLSAAGLRLTRWETSGFLAWSLLMNSDVLVFNRAFGRVPGIRRLTRLGARLDDSTLALPGMGGSGVQVIGTAERA